MPTINGGRVTDDGRGSVGYKAEPTPTGGNGNGNNGNGLGNGGSLLDVDVNLSLGGIKTVTGRNLGSGKPLFAGSNGSSSVTLDFKSLVAGSGVTLTEAHDTITIAYAADARKVSFLNLYEAPASIVPMGLLFGDSTGNLSFTQTPTIQDSVLSFNGVGFVWKKLASSGTVTSVAATGDNAIRVSGGPITSTGTLALSLANTTVVPGQYTAATITVDAQGRVTSATATPVGEVNVGANLGAGAQVFAGKDFRTLNFKTIKGFGAVSINETDSEITIGALAGVSSVGLTGSADILVSGATVTSAGSFALAMSNTGVTAGTYNRVTVDAKGRVTAASNVTQPSTDTASNVGTGDAIFLNKVGSDFRFKTIAGAGALQVLAGANTVTLRVDALQGLEVTASGGIELTGNTLITSGSGRFNVGLANSGVTAGAYTNASITVDAKGRVTAVANGATLTSTASNTGTGIGVFGQKSGTNFEFKSIAAGSNMTVTENNGTITLAAVIPAAQAPTAPLSVTNGSTTYSTITSLVSGAGVRITQPAANVATITSGIGLTDDKGATVGFTSFIDLVGLTLTQNNGRAVITAPAAPLKANATVSDDVANIVNPTKVKFVGATVTGTDNGVALVTIPTAQSSSLIVSHRNGGVEGSTDVFSGVKTLKFEPDFAVTTTQNAGEVVIGLAPVAQIKTIEVQGTSTANAPVFAPTRIVFGGNAAISYDAASTTATVFFPQSNSSTSANAVLLTTDQSVQGKKTFTELLTVLADITASGSITSTLDVSVGRNLTVAANTILNGLLQARNGIDATGDVKSSGSFNVTRNNGSAITALTATGTTASGGLSFDQTTGRWSAYLANGVGGFSGNLTGNVTGNVSGTSGSTTKLTIARLINLTGDVTGTTLFDGTQDRFISTTLSDTGVTSGTYTYPTITVDAQGRVRSISSNPAPGAGGGANLINVGTGIALYFPGTDGDRGQYLRTIKAGNGVIVGVDASNALTLDVDTSGFGTVKQVAINGDNGIIASGSPITNTGTYTLSLANTTVQAGTYSNPTITVDSTGRITMALTGNTVSSSDTATNLGTGDGHVFAQKTGAGVFQFRSLVAGTNVNMVETGETITVNAVIPAFNSNAISSVTVTDGTTTANATTLSFTGGVVTQTNANTATIKIPGGTVTSISAQGDNAIQVTGSPITTFGTIGLKLANTGVAAGTYNYATITVDAQGRVTAASENATPTGSAGGTVTSIAVAAPSSDLIVSGSPITTSGTINLALSNTPVTAGSYGNPASTLVVTVDAKGRLTAAQSVAIAIPSSAITDATSSPTPNTLVKRDANGAVAATSLSTARTIALSADVTGSATFDGTANATITATLANTTVTPGTYQNPNITVDSKGRITNVTTGSATIIRRHSDVVVVTDAAVTSYTFKYNAQTLTLNGNFLQVYLNRMLLRPGEYTADTTTVTVSYGLNTGDELEVVTIA